LDAIAAQIPIFDIMRKALEAWVSGK